MNTEENKTNARRAYDAMNESIRTGNFASLEKVLDTNVVDHNPTPGQRPGLEGAKQAFAAYRTAFPDMQFTVDDVIAEGDKVVSRITARGTHTGHGGAH